MVWTFGEDPLPQTEELAARLRRLASRAVSMEEPRDELADLIAQLDAVELALEAAGPADLAPRVGDAADTDGRVYVDHSRDIGAFNPVFPTYAIDVDDDHASGTVEFPVVYEGPPGIVHGGFIAVFFDCVIQHHNCDVGTAGKTTRLDVRFKRPTPLRTPLTFTIDRIVRGDRIESQAQLLLGGRPCAEATMEAIAGDRSALPPVSNRRGVPR